MSLGPDLRDALTALAGEPRILVGTDFDGVLAPLVEDPSRSRPLPGSMRLLRLLAASPGVVVAVVSGRHLGALRTLTGLTPDDRIVLVGSHGAEADPELALDLSFDQAARARLDAATQALSAVVRAHPPTRLEHKPAGVVLHTRAVAEHVAQAATAAALAIDLAGVDVMVGKQIVELSVLPVTKGTALQALATDRDTVATLYLGDDVTDERAFDALGDDRRNVTIKVGDGQTVARFRVGAPPDVLDVLQLLSDLRSR